MVLIGTIQVNQAEFPTLFRIALDYLPIQASSVPCERVFSSAKETDTTKRNRIHPVLMEALQTLKFSLKKDRLNFTGGWKTEPGNMKGTGSTKDFLARLLTGDRQATTDDLLHALSDGDDDDNDNNKGNRGNVGNVGNVGNDSGDDGEFEDVFCDNDDDVEEDDE